MLTIERGNMTYWMISKTLHIISGAFWVGAAIMIAGFILPSARKAGPAGGLFMQQLAGVFRLPLAMNIASWTASLSGLLLLWRYTGGFQVVSFQWPSGIGIAVGSFCGILALLWGFFYQAPNAKLLSKLLQKMSMNPAPETIALIDIQQQKILVGARIGAILLILCLVGMTLLH